MTIDPQKAQPNAACHLSAVCSAMSINGTSQPQTRPGRARGRLRGEDVPNLVQAQVIELTNLTISQIL